MFLLTDYGLEDELAGVLRASVIRIAPRAPVVDLGHGLPPFDVRAGALALARSVPHLGKGIVVAVVDPGVATDRRPVAIEVAPRRRPRVGGGDSGTGAGPELDAEGPRYLVGPDNGLLCWALEALGGALAAVELTVARRERSTFDGRDVFAPAAARLWLGEPLEQLGSRIDPSDIVKLDPLRCDVTLGRIDTEITWIDRFGNVQLVACPMDMDLAGLSELSTLQLEVGGRVFGARSYDSFAEVPQGEVGLVVDANGRLAVAADRRSAARLLEVTVGERVVIRSV